MASWLAEIKLKSKQSAISQWKFLCLNLDAETKANVPPEDTKKKNIAESRH